MEREAAMGGAGGRDAGRRIVLGCGLFLLRVWGQGRSFLWFLLVKLFFICCFSKFCHEKALRHTLTPKPLQLNWYFTTTNRSLYSKNVMIIIVIYGKTIF